MPAILGPHVLLRSGYCGTFLDRSEQLDDLFRAHAQSAKRCQARFDGTIWNLFGMKLQIDPAVDPHGCDLLNIPGAWTERQAIQRLHRGSH